MMKILIIIAVAIGIITTTACNSEKNIVNIDASMLLGRWVTIDAEEQCKWKPSIKNKLDSTDYIYTKMDVYESMIETTIPNEIGKGIIGNYFIDKNNALWGYGANGRFWAEGDNPYVFRINELTSDKLVFEYDYHKKKCKCIAIYTLKKL
jgi:hypothetical protein